MSHTCKMANNTRQQHGEKISSEKTGDLKENKDTKDEKHEKKKSEKDNGTKKTESRHALKLPSSTTTSTSKKSRPAEAPGSARMAAMKSPLHNLHYDDGEMGWSQQSYWGPAPPPGWGFYDYPPMCTQDMHWQEWDDAIDDVEDDQSQIQDGENDDSDMQDGETTPQGSNEEIDESLLQGHVGNYNEEVGEPVPTKLADSVNEHWDAGNARDFTKEVLKPLYAKYPVPSNTHLHKVSLNDQLMDTIPKFVRSKDLRVKSIQTAISRAAVPMTTIVQELLTKPTPDKQKLVDTAFDSLSMLAGANAGVNNIRRENLRSSLQGKYVSLVSKKVPAESKLLFGEDLTDKIKAVNQADRITITRGRPYAGRGGGMFGFKSNRMQPYARGSFKAPYNPYQAYNSYQRGGYNHFLGKQNTFTTKPNLVYDTTKNNLKLIPIQVEHIELVNSACEIDNAFLSTFRPTGTRSTEAETNLEIDGRSKMADTAEDRVGKSKCIKKQAFYVDLERWKKFKAGRISTRLHRWERLTSDQRILDDIRGFRIPFLREPIQTRIPNPIRFSDKERDVVRNEIESLLGKQVIEKVDHSSGEFISNIFVREKKDQGKYRMILNLKNLNENFVEYQHFKMDSLDAVLQLIKRDSYLASLDFKDAYYSLLVHSDHRKYLRFEFEGQLYQFRVLPNGLACGPRLFTKIMKVPLSILRQTHGITISGYLDDTISIEDTPAISDRAMNIAADLLQDLGFMINIPKSVPKGTWELDHLGFLINSHTMLVTLPEQKRHSLIHLVEKTVKKETLTIRDMAQVIGALMATSHGNKYAQLYTKQLEIDKTTALGQNSYNFDAKMSISDQARTDLKWWHVNLLKGVSKPIAEPKSDWEIRTDASTTGWGAFWTATGESCGTPWNESERLKHINYLELRAILFGLQSFAGNLQDCHIRILTDNMTAMACVNNQGSTRSKDCNTIAREIWLWASSRNIWVSTKHLPGVENTEADRASRQFKDDIEWSLADNLFNFLCKEWASPDIDLFASRLNKKNKTFCSWKPDPEASYVDAFSINWSGKMCYAFPPFCLIGKVIQKFERDGAQGLVIVPFWPTKPWFSRLGNLLIEEPYIIPVTDKVLSLPFSQKSHPLAGRLRIMACRISGNPSDVEGFRQRLLQRCYKPNDNQLQTCITLILQDGDSFVPKTTYIPTRPLSRRAWNICST